MTDRTDHESCRRIERGLIAFTEIQRVEIAALLEQRDELRRQVARSITDDVDKREQEEAT